MNKAEKLKRERLLQRAKQIQISRKPSDYNIAAFDQATLCGISFEKEGTNKTKTELWDLSRNAKESQGMKWIKFEARVTKFFKKNNINIIAYEMPAGRHANAIIHSAKLICVLEKVATQLGIEYIEYPSPRIKFFATANGNAGKPLMIKFAQKLWGYKGKDDNEADSLHILHYLKSQINS